MWSQDIFCTRGPEMLREIANSRFGVKKYKMNVKQPPRAKSQGRKTRGPGRTKAVLERRWWPRGAQFWHVQESKLQ